MSEKPLVSAEEMESVLATETSADDPRTGSTDGTPERYSLRRPVAISADAEDAARARIESLANALATTFGNELEMTIEIQVAGFQQQQVKNAIGSIDDPAWILSFAGVDGGGLALVLDPVCALTLVEVSLGGLVAPPGAPRDPTPLERRLLDALARAMLPNLVKHTGMPFADTHFTVGRVPEIVAAGGEVVGTAIVSIAFDGEQRKGLLLLTANMLREAEASKESGELVAGPLTPALLRVELDARPVLRAGAISLGELHEFRPGTVVRLEAPVERPLELRIADETVFRGRVVRDADGAQFGVEWRRGAARSPDSPASGEEETP